MEGKKELPEMTHQVNAEEGFRAFNRAQGILAVSEYVADNDLPLDPMVIVQRHEHAADETSGAYNIDTRPAEIRHDALEAWTAIPPGGTKSIGDIFRAYWEDEKNKSVNRAVVEAAIKEGQAARLELIKKILATQG